MALVNGKIVKGDDCPYKNGCMFKINACNGEGCPFITRSDHFCDFSCGAARYFKMVTKRNEEKQ